MAKTQRAAPASGDGGIADPIVYNSVEDIGVVPRTLTLPNGVQIDANEFESMDYEDQRAFLVNMTRSDKSEIE